MNPAQTAYDDQLQAAVTDARRMLEWRATSTNTPMGKATSPWLQAKVREFRENLLAGKVRYCPHISQTPMVAHTAAWATDRLVCTACAPCLAPDETEATRCDQCGHATSALYLGCAVNGPVLMAYGLCLDCARLTQQKGR